MDNIKLSDLNNLAELKWLYYALFSDMSMTTFRSDIDTKDIEDGDVLGEWISLDFKLARLDHPEELICHVIKTQIVARNLQKDEENNTVGYRVSREEEPLWPPFTTIGDGCELYGELFDNAFSNAPTNARACLDYFRSTATKKNSMGALEAKPSITVDIPTFDSCDMWSGHSKLTIEINQKTGAIRFIDEYDDVVLEKTLDELLDSDYDTDFVNDLEEKLSHLRPRRD